jgi:hypothetical protein
MKPTTRQAIALAIITAAATAVTYAVYASCCLPTRFWIPVGIL